MTPHALATAIAADLAQNVGVAVFLDSIGTDEAALVYPYAVVAPSQHNHTPGGDEITIEVGVAIRADANGDTSKPVETEGGHFSFGEGELLDALLSAIRSRLSGWTLGAIPTGSDSVSYEFGSYPVQSAILSFSFTIIQTFED